MALLSSVEGATTNTTSTTTKGNMTNTTKKPSGKASSALPISTTGGLMALVSMVLFTKC